MLAFKLKVKFNDSSEIETGIPPAVQVAFERHFDVSIGGLGDNLRMEQIYWMVWETCRKRGQTALDFDAWLDTIESVDMGEGLDPTETTP